MFEYSKYFLLPTFFLCFYLFAIPTWWIKRKGNIAISLIIMHEDYYQQVNFWEAHKWIGFHWKIDEEENKELLYHLLAITFGLLALFLVMEP